MTDSVDEVFACEGEMAERMAVHDWGATPLGPPSGWSQSLRTAVAIMLRTRYPMLLSWGEQLVMLYNDAFIATLGTKHPGALGGLLAVEFGEVWDDVGPMQAAVLAGGPANWFEDLPLNIERGEGLEEAYFTFSYSHVPDESGLGGVLAVLSVTTDKVVAARRLGLLNELSTVDLAGFDPATVRSVVMRRLSEATSELQGGALYERLPRSGDDQPRLARIETFGHDCQDVLPRLSVGSDAPIAAALLSGRPVTFRRACPHTDTKELVLVAVPLHDGDDEGSVLVLCPHPLRPLDTDHQDFLGLLGRQVRQRLSIADERAREQARLESLAALDTAKTAFLSSVSHEFRTPLTLLLGPFEDVLSGRSAEIGRDEVDVMYANAHRLLRMVNGLLDVARIEADGLEAALEPTDLAGLTEDLVRPFEAAADRAGLRLEQRLDPDLGVVEVDPSLWEKIVVNLLANAVKFTDAGTISVDLAAADDRVVLSVTDTGVGIPESEIDLVFDRFHRVSGGHGRTIEGTGIGLALAAECARSLGGTVSVRSEVGLGSVFETTIPFLPTTAHLGATQPLRRPEVDALAQELAPAGTPEETVAMVSKRSAGPRRPMILVAEDNPAMRARVAHLLDDVGDVVTVPDGREALAVLRTHAVDLLVSDVMMPWVDGLELLKEIRADDQLRVTPVVLLSARAGPEAAAEAVAAGADDYVVKPFTAGELLARCRTTLELAQHRANDAATRARSTLLAGVSHDMQTPLAVIISTLELLSGDDLGPVDRVLAADRARARAEQLRQLVTQFLDWSRLSTNEPLPIRVSTCDLRTICSQVAGGHERATVTCDVDQVRVTCDPQRTEQILHNLVDNAERFARSAIDLRLDTSDGFAVLRVRDDGPGVDPEVRGHLFEAFGPSAGSTGNGLGLHVAREAARAQGGDLVLEHSGPEGAVFTLDVPLAAS